MKSCNRENRFSIDSSTASTESKNSSLLTEMWQIGFACASRRFVSALQWQEQVALVSINDLLRCCSFCSNPRWRTNAVYLCSETQIFKSYFLVYVCNWNDFFFFCFFKKRVSSNFGDNGMLSNSLCKICISVRLVICAITIFLTYVIFFSFHTHVSHICCHICFSLSRHVHCSAVFFFSQVLSMRFT